MSRHPEPVAALTREAIAAVLDHADTLEPAIVWIEAVLTEYVPGPVAVNPSLLLRNPDGTQGVLAVLRDPEGSGRLCWCYDVPSIAALYALAPTEALPEVHEALRGLDYGRLDELTADGDLAVLMCLTTGEQVLRDAWLRAVYARHLEDRYAAYPEPAGLLDLFGPDPPEPEAPPDRDAPWDPVL